MTRDLSKSSYDPSEVEAHYRKLWLKSGLARAARKGPRKPYSIVMPPPNVTGRLHMGHALGQTVQDILIRFRRMQGFDVMWIPGTDHAGIATQSVVERDLLSKEGIRRSELSREQFLEYCWKWKNEYEASILDQIQLLGCSCDWTMKAFSMDEPRSQAVRTCFKKLFDKGLIYRGDYLVNWDPVSRTALADDEVEYEERVSTLYHIRYITEDGDSLIIATTRPETMLGDTAVAVHPNDERYKHLLGKHVVLPFNKRLIPIVADGFVDPEFGTGAVKITPAHDQNDYQMALRHNLEMINILNDDGTLNEKGLQFEGQDVLSARQNLVAALKEMGLLVSQSSHQNRVGISYRSKAVIEPKLSKQWFVKLSAFKGILRECVETKRVELVPSLWENTYFHWIDNLRDWCISRQLWWGHRIPVWYHVKDASRMICYEGDGVPAEVAAAADEWVQDSDVLDTWFSSALWPMSTLGWPDTTEELERYFPTSVLVTGYDILFFWVARMILMAELMESKPPFAKVYLHGLIFGKSYWTENKPGEITYITGQERSEYDSGTPLPKGVFSKWEKMSKSKGNVIDPIEIINSYGADAMRMALASSLGDARQIDLDRRRFEEFKNFSNKIYNSARFVFMNIDNEPSLTAESFGEGLDINALLTEDIWILETYADCVKKVSEHLEAFEFSAACSLSTSFFWDDFCAYYVEISKPVLWGKAATAKERLNKQKILSLLLSGSLRLLHPFVPFITEDLTNELRERLLEAKIGNSADALTLETIEALKSPLCMTSPFPKEHRPLQDRLRAKQALDTMIFLKEVIFRVRQLRGEMKILSGTPTELYADGEEEKIKELEKHLYAIKALVPISEFVTQKRVGEGQLGCEAILQDLMLTVPLPLEMAKLEKKRRLKQKIALEANFDQLSSRLSNEDFLAKAPEALVEKQKAQLKSIKEELEAINKQLAALDKIP